MLKTLEQFICDTCGDVIESVNDGWIEWEGSYENDEAVNKNFRICHHDMNCQKLADHRHCSDLPLSEICGEKTHAFLYTHLDVGPYHKKKYSKPTIVDFREYVELMRRLTIPYYEEARQWWSEATSDGYFSEANEESIYLPENLKRMIEHYSES